MKKQKHLKERSKRKINKKMLIIRLVQLTFLILIIISLIEIYNWYKENKANEQILKDISNAIVVVENDEENQKYKIDFGELKKKNEDVVAWIKVNNTKIEYPVVKSKNNDYYLNHSLDKSYNIAGWIFADYRNNFNGEDKNIIVYGHNRRDGSMFGSLKNILDEEWDENRNIIFATEEKVSTYRVFSVYQVEKEDYYIQTEFKGDEFEKFIEELKRRSKKDFDEEVDKDSQILTLSTCANNNKYRVVLHAVKVEE